MERGLKPAGFGVETAASGERTLFFEREGRRHYVYSRRDPVLDGLRYRSEHPFGGSALLVFIGVGLGHHIRPFLEDGETEEIAVLEPCEELFDAGRSSSSPGTRGSRSTRGRRRGGTWKGSRGATTPSSGGQ
jgi:hypothetical protein